MAPTDMVKVTIGEKSFMAPFSEAVKILNSYSRGPKCPECDGARLCACCGGAGKLPEPSGEIG